MDRAKKGRTLVYCDPPYFFHAKHTLSHKCFSLERLFAAIQRCKARGVFVAPSTSSGTKKSGKYSAISPFPRDCSSEAGAWSTRGRSMLQTVSDQRQEPGRGSGCR